MRIDLGDAILNIQLEIPGLNRYRMRRHFGVPREATSQERQNEQVEEFAFLYNLTTPDWQTGVIMDLAADMGVDVNVEWTDEMGNPTGEPADATVSWATDDTSILSVTDNGDGSAFIAAVGTLGRAHVRVTASAGGKTFVGEDEIVVVPGLAERVNLAFGEPREVTPDDQSTEPTPQPVL